MTVHHGTLCPHMYSHLEQFKVSNPSTGMFLGGGREPEETGRNVEMERTCKTLLQISISESGFKSALWVKGMAYLLYHSDTSQSWTSVGSRMQKRADNALLQVCYTAA